MSAVVLHDVEVTLFGVPWDGTFVAALVAALASLGGVYVNYRQNAALSARQDWFNRFQLALEQVQSRNVEVAATGVDLIRSLVSAKWASKEDKMVAAAALARFDARPSGGRWFR